MIGRQFQRLRRASELLLPIRELTFKRLALKPLPLPAGIISILNRQFPER
jgi:hypothetical protein